MKALNCALLILGLVLVSMSVLAKDAAYKPFVLASSNAGTLEETTQATIDALVAAGFEVAGQYSPVDEIGRAHV